jgi:ATP-dependent Zn protease
MTNTAHTHCTVAWWRRPPVWVAAVIVVGLAIFAIMEAESIPSATPYGTFLDQLTAGNVAGVTFKGTEIDGNYKQPVSGAPDHNTKSTDAFRTRAPDFGDPDLISELRKQHVAIDVTSSSSWWRLLAGIPLPMLLFLVFIAVAAIVRLVRGGKSSSSSNMPVHPMQGLLRLASDLMGKREPVEAPPKPAAAEPDRSART